jgi:hypothetical protein
MSAADKGVESTGECTKQAAVELSHSFEAAQRFHLAQFHISTFYMAIGGQFDNLLLNNSVAFKRYGLRVPVRGHQGR